MINTTHLLQALSGANAGAATAGGVASANPGSSGMDFAQQLQRLTQANAANAQPIKTAMPEPSALATRESSPARPPSPEGQPSSAAAEDAAPDERAHAAEEAPPNTPARKPAAPRKARSEAGDAAKDRTSAEAATPADAEEAGETTEPGSARVRIRKLGGTGADASTDAQASGLATASLSPLHAGGRAAGANADDSSRLDGAAGKGQAVDALQATAQAAAVRRALLAAGEPSEGAALQAAAVGDAADAATPALPEGLTPVLSPLTAFTPTGSAPGAPADTRILASPSTDAGAAAQASAHRTEEVDGTVGSAMFAQSLGARISVLARDGIDQARLNVHPADMGPIAVRLALDGNQVRVDLSAELGSTRQALEQSLPALASALQDAGFTLAGGGVFQQARDGASPQRGEAGTPGAGDRRSGMDARDVPVQADSRSARPRGLVDLIA